MEHRPGTTFHASATPHGPRHYALVGFASMVGTTIEWYDFFLYGTAAALIFNKLFFPAIDPLMGTLAAFATYAVGFLARPLGAAVFGHYGDRIGRKSMLMATLFLMGLPTTAIGLIPTYNSIGYWAAVLLVLMRFLQGVAVGGEWGGAALMAVEHAPAGKKAFFGSLPQAGVGAGLILSSLAMAAATRLPESELLAWGWRVPFLVSVVLLGVGFFVRLKLAESPAFESVRERGQQVELPVLEIFKTYPRAVVTVIGARLIETIWFYTVTTFSLAYATQNLHLTKVLVLNATVAGAAVSLLTIPLVGRLCDRVGARPVYISGALTLCAAAIAFFALLATRETGALYAAMILAIGGVFPLLYAPESALFAAQFPAAVRYSGISLSVQLAGAIGGGAAPIVATSLLKAGQGSTYLISAYLIGLAVLAMVCVGRMRGGHVD